MSSIAPKFTRPIQSGRRAVEALWLYIRDPREELSGMLESADEIQGSARKWASGYRGRAFRCGRRD